ncbi:CRISPR-associated endoribonuclease Cas6 [Desulfothermus okinawensis]
MNFKETNIKGWIGIYKFHLPQSYFTVAYSTGLVSKNSQGCGLF